MLSLYRKYRPRSFSEVSGQIHVIRTLTNAIKNDHIGHAYLLTGPRGTGKTTIARIFAKTINCQSIVKNKASNINVEPCNKCENCKIISENKALDLIEIDAASHTGVDNIRQLKETVPLPSSVLEYKIYIIDEVHMLSMGAFNALLKTLEEPPAHTVFILATTELHKVPETIISRCQRFDIALLTEKQIMERLAFIAKKEGVKIEKEALETIALEADGGMRDAISMLDQIMALEDKEITAKEVHQILGTSSKKSVVDFVELVINCKTKEALGKIDELQNEGINLRNFNKNILSFLRNLIFFKTNPKQAGKMTSGLTDEQIKRAEKMVERVSLDDVLKLIDLFQESLSKFKETSIPQLPLELAVIGYSVNQKNSLAEISNVPERTVIDNSNIELTQTAKRQNDKGKENKSETKKPKQEEEIDKPSSFAVLQDSKKQTKTNKPAVEKRTVSKNTAIKLDTALDNWSEILKEVKPHNHSIHAFLKNCVPCGVQNETLYIKTKYDFYKDKLSENNNRLTIQEAVDKILGVSLKVDFVTETGCKNMNFEKPSEKKNVLHDAMQMMGGRIVKS